MNLRGEKAPAYFALGRGIDLYNTVAIPLSKPNKSARQLVTTVFYKSIPSPKSEIIRFF
jgi:hypothetical protein